MITSFEYIVCAIYSFEVWENFHKRWTIVFLFGTIAICLKNNGSTTRVKPRKKSAWTHHSTTARKKLRGSIIIPLVQLIVVN